MWRMCRHFSPCWVDLHLNHCERKIFQKKFACKYNFSGEVKYLFAVVLFCKRLVSEQEIHLQLELKDISKATKTARIIKYYKGGVNGKRTPMRQLLPQETLATDRFL